MGTVPEPVPHQCSCLSSEDGPFWGAIVGGADLHLLVRSLLLLILPSSRAPIVLLPLRLLTIPVPSPWASSPSQTPPPHPTAICKQLSGTQLELDAWR